MLALFWTDADEAIFNGKPSRAGNSVSRTLYDLYCGVVQDDIIISYFLELLKIRIQFCYIRTKHIQTTEKANPFPGQSDI